MMEQISLFLLYYWNLPNGTQEKTCWLLMQKTSSTLKCIVEQEWGTCCTSDENQRNCSHSRPPARGQTTPRQLHTTIKHVCVCVCVRARAHIHAFVDFLIHYLTAGRHMFSKTLTLSNKSHTNLISFSPSASMTCRICLGVIGASE